MRFYTLLLVILFSARAMAQYIFPVKVEARFNYPPLMVNDLMQPGVLTVNIMLTDALRSELDVVVGAKLVGVEGFDSVLCNSVDVKLRGGQVNMLSVYDLASMFNIPQKNAYVKEGQFFAMFNVREKKTGIMVSNAMTDVAVALVSKNNPPYLMMPVQNSEIDQVAGASQPVMFSWMVAGLPVVPGVNIKYNLEIAELPPGLPPATAFSSNEIISIDDLDVPSLVYTPDQKPFEQGKSYAWRVTAWELNSSGEVTSNRFYNNGMSDIYVFRVREDCPPVSPLGSVSVIPSDDGLSKVVNLQWTQWPQHVDYELRYKTASEPYTIVHTPSNSMSIDSRDLVAGATYEYSVAQKCVSWHRPGEKGTFALASDHCAAPAGIVVSKNDHTGISISWDASPGVTAYKVNYLDNGTTGATNQVIEVLAPDTSFVLPKIYWKSYTVRVDAQCASGAIVNGTDQIINQDAGAGWVGECPLPHPLKLDVSLDDINPIITDLKWKSLPYHSSFAITYRNADSATSTPRTLAGLTTNSASDSRIVAGQLYEYSITFVCSNGKTVTSPTALFMVEPAGGLVLPVTPNTANCFPPAVISAEVKDASSALFDWQTVKGATGYILTYYPENNIQDVKVFSSTAASANIKGFENKKYLYSVACQCNGATSIQSTVGSLDMSAVSTSACAAMDTVMVGTVTRNEIQLSWSKELDANNVNTRSGYTIYYKAANQTWDQKYTIDLKDISVLDGKHCVDGTYKYTVSNLDVSTTYNFKVEPYCPSQTKPGVSSTVVTATTEAGGTGDCASAVVPCDSKAKGSPTLNVGDTIQLYDNKIILSEVSTNPGNIKGYAVIRLFSSPTPVNATLSLENATVNDKMCVSSASSVKIENISATIPSVSIPDITGTLQNSLNSTLGNVSSPVNNQVQGINLASFQGGANMGLPTPGAMVDPSTYSGTISSLSGVSYSNGQFSVGGQAVSGSVIQDQSGNIYAATKNNAVVPVGAIDLSLAGVADKDIDTVSGLVAFDEAPGASFGFDAAQAAYCKAATIQPHLICAAGRCLASKAIAPNVVDYVRFTTKGVNVTTLKFVNDKGHVLPFSNGKLTLLGGKAGVSQKVMAVVVDGANTRPISGLLLASYALKHFGVKIIPVGDIEVTQANLDLMQAALNDAYGQACITFTLELDTRFQDSRWCGSSECLPFQPSKGAALNADYTGSELDIIKRYKSSNFVDNDSTAYVFLVGQPVDNSSGDEGSMPGRMKLLSKAGFLYGVSAKTDFSIYGRVLAHELGHGCFGLRHIFDDAYLGPAAKNGTNVMSNSLGSSATKLAKFQWDIIHSPASTWKIPE